MRPQNFRARTLAILISGMSCAIAPIAQAADKALLDVLFENGVITQAQYDNLMQKESLTSKDILGPAATSVEATVAKEVVVEDLGTSTLDAQTELAIAEAVARELEASTSVVASQGSKGFRLATRDGDWETNLQWRGQFRYSNPTGSDPRQLDDFAAEDSSSFEARRLRMKIGGHGFKPWLKYYFEVDLQPARDVDADATSSGARVIDWRVDIAKLDWLGVRLGQWKVDLNRERVDSSGRQQFVERSIVNRNFTVDRQVGIQLKGHLFKGTGADMRYWAGIFNGEGRSVRNDGDDHLYMARVQWNFLGRDLAWRQTDVEYTDLPTGSLAFATFTNEGTCTRWSSSGCGNLDGFSRPGQADPEQYKIDQYVQEFAFKYRGLSIQQEYHRKNIDDQVLGINNEMTGFYAQTGYFFHNLIPSFPAELELAARYAYVEEPNEVDRLFDNEREEFSIGANWFFAGHNNKLTLDYSYLTLEDGLVDSDDSKNRVRLQWEVSF